MKEEEEEKNLNTYVSLVSEGGGEGGGEEGEENKMESDFLMKEEKDN